MSTNFRERVSNVSPPSAAAAAAIGDTAGGAARLDGVFFEVDGDDSDEEVELARRSLVAFIPGCMA